MNLGKKAGLAALLRKELPYLVDFHCLPHRLELALLELQNSCKSVDDVYTVLHLIWKSLAYNGRCLTAQTKGAEQVVHPVVVVDVNGIRCCALLDTRAGSSYASSAILEHLGNPTSLRGI